MIKNISVIHSIILERKIGNSNNRLLTCLKDIVAGCSYISMLIALQVAQICLYEIEENNGAIIDCFPEDIQEV